MKKFLSLLMISTMLSSTVVRAQSTVAYNCAEDYGAVYAKTLQKNMAECDECYPGLNKAGVATASVAGAGYYAATIITIGAPAIAIGLFGVVLVGYGGYYAGKQVSHSIRYLKGNPYHQANQAIAMSLVPEEAILTKKNQITKLTEKLNKVGLEVDYKTVKAKIAELSQTNLFCEDGQPVKFSEMKNILIEEMGLSLK